MKISLFRHENTLSEDLLLLVESFFPRATQCYISFCSEMSSPPHLFSLAVSWYLPPCLGLLFNSPTDTASDGNPPHLSLYPPHTHTRTRPSLSSPSLPSAGSRWLLVNSAQCSPRQFNSHCSSNSTTMALFSRGGRAHRMGWVCVCVCACVCVCVCVCVGGGVANPNAESRLVNATDRQRVLAAFFWQRCIFFVSGGCRCPLLHISLKAAECIHGNSVETTFSLWQGGKKNMQP